MWRIYEVKLRFRNRLVGGIPQEAESLRKWLERRNQDSRYLELLGYLDNEKPIEEIPHIGFLRDPEKGLFLESRQIKSGLKKAANVCRAVLGFKGFMKARLNERVFIEPDKIFLNKDKPDGTLERFVHVVTPLGQRSAVKLCDYVQNAEITFRLKVLDDGVITREHLEFLFAWLQEAGLGAERGQSEGKFDVIYFEEISEN